MIICNNTFIKKFFLNLSFFPLSNEDATDIVIFWKPFSEGSRPENQNHCFVIKDCNALHGPRYLVLSSYRSQKLKDSQLTSLWEVLSVKQKTCLQLGLRWLQ